MAWFHNIFNSPPPPAAPAPVPPVKPVELTKIAAPNAGQITQQFSPKPDSLALLQPQQTPGEYVAQLEQHKQSEDAIKTLAYGMPERESTWYACQSSQRVAGKLAPEDKQALAAAEAWVKDPTPETQAQAAAAAAKTDFQGPGAWSAQAAAWSQTTAGATATPAVNQASLTPHAAAGAVLLAAALESNVPMPPPPPKPSFQIPAAPNLQVPQTPAMTPPELTPPQLAQTAKIHQPFIDLGKEIASGKNTWA